MFDPGEKKFVSDKHPEDIHIRPNECTGPEAVIGYDLSKSLSFELALEWINSGENIDKNNTDMLQQFPLRVSILHKININKEYTPYVGAGVSTPLSIKYEEEAQGIKSEIIYNKPIGFNLLGVQKL